MVNKEPIVSIVVVVRNDNYGGGFTARFQYALDNLDLYTRKYEIMLELVLVNYNPIEYNTDFIDLIKWPTTNDFLIIRMYTVTKEIHTSIMAESTERLSLPVLEFIAKNVGVRRANAPFILCTNADIVFPETFYLWLKKEKINTSFFYRANRFDFERSNNTPNKITISYDDVTKVYLKLGQFSRLKLLPFSLFLLLARGYGRFMYAYANFSSNFDFLVKYRHIIPYRPKRESFLGDFHFNACGDFTLTAKENWQKLRAYPENTYSAMHTDSLFIAACAAVGLKESILPFPVFHQAHPNTFEHNAKHYYQDPMFIRLVEEANRMLGEGAASNWNDENWGLFNYPIEEIRIL